MREIGWRPRTCMPPTAKSWHGGRQAPICWVCFTARQQAQEGRCFNAPTCPAWEVSGATKVVSMGNLDPFHKKKPLTSIRRSSVREHVGANRRACFTTDTGHVPKVLPLTAMLRSEGTLPGGPPVDRASGGIGIWLACVARGAEVVATTKPRSGQIQKRGLGMLVAT